MRSRSRAVARTVTFLALAGAALAAAAAAGTASGGLEQAGCIDATGANGCAAGRGVEGPGAIAVSRDGRSVYKTTSRCVPTEGGADCDHVGTLATFARDPQTGALRQLDGAAGCVSSDRETDCGAGVGIDGAGSVVVSPDGRNVYAGSLYDIAIFTRDPASGALSQAPLPDACVGRFGCREAYGQTFGPAQALGGAHLATSADGRNAYAATDRGNAVMAFARRSGRLRELGGRAGCFSWLGEYGCRRLRSLEFAAAIAISPDGRQVMTGGSTVSVFARSPRAGALAPVRGPAGCPRKGCGQALSIAYAPDGRNVYVSYHGPPATIRGFRRAPNTGRLTALADASARGSGALAVSGDGRSVYVAGGNVVTVFARNRATGALSRRGTVDVPGAVIPALSPDGRNLYVATATGVAIFTTR